MMLLNYKTSFRSLRSQTKAREKVSEITVGRRSMGCIDRQAKSIDRQTETQNIDRQIGLIDRQA